MNVLGGFNPPGPVRPIILSVTTPHGIFTGLQNGPDTGREEEIGI